MTDLKRLLLTKLELLRLFYEDRVDWQDVQDFLVSIISLSPYPDDRRWAEEVLADDVYKIRGRHASARDDLEWVTSYLQEPTNYGYSSANVFVPIAGVLTYSVVGGPLTFDIRGGVPKQRCELVDTILETRLFQRIHDNTIGPRSRFTFMRLHGPALEAGATLARLLWDTGRRESDIGHPRITSVTLRAVAMYASMVYHD